MTKVYQIVLKFIKDNPGFVVISVVYLVSFLAMLPLRDQAFEDDFAYIHTVRTLVNTGELKISEWVAPTTVFIAYWGFLFSKIFGYSIATLHLSNVVLMYFGIISFFLLLKRCGLSEFRSAVFALLLASYPLVFQFSYSVMTDTFHMSLMCISLYLFVRGIQENSPGILFIASVFSGFTFLARQLGVTLPIAIFLTMMYSLIINKKLRVKQFMAAILPFSIIISIYYLWLNQVGMTIGMYLGAVEPLKNHVLPALFPIEFKTIYASHSLYLEAFIRRGVFYINNALPFLLLIFLIFKFNLKQVRLFFANNSRKIFTSFIIITSIYALSNYYQLGKLIWTIPSSVLLVHDKILGPTLWDKIWVELIFISIIPWVIVFAISFGNIFNAIFQPRKVTKKKLFRISLFGIILYNIWFIIAMFNTAYPWIADSLFTPYNSLTHAISLAMLDFKNYGFFLAITSCLLLFIAYITFFKKFRQLHETQLSVLFVGLNFILSMLFILMVSKFFYAEYIISFVPFIVFLLAYTTNNLQINKPLAVTLVILMFVFSWQITRSRYQTIGYDWETATRVVERGGNPYGLAINWAWRPYWKFESTIQETIKKYDGDKYAVPWEEMRSWYYGPFIDQPRYETISKEGIEPIADQKEIMIESEYFRAFFWEPEKKTYVFIKKP